MRQLFVYILLIFLLSCQKKQPDSTLNNPVPSVPVNFTMYPGDPLNYKIQSIGGWMYVDNVGINGIIVYRKSNEEFVAIERTSSYLPNNSNAKVKVMSDNFLLLDSISDSKWRIVDANVSSGPATWPLRLYGANYLNGTLRISN